MFALGGLVLLAVLAVAAAWFWRRGDTAAEQPDATTAQQTVETTDDRPPSLPPERIDRRWLPDGTVIVLSYRALPSGGVPRGAGALEKPWTLWQETCGAAIEALGLDPMAIRRITLATDELAGLPQRCVLAIELQPEYDTSFLEKIGEPAGLVLFGQQCRRVPRGNWTHAVALVGKSIVLTGHEDILRHLNSRSQARIRSAAIEQLAAAAADIDFELALLLDLQAAREAGWPLPQRMLDVWPQGKTAWSTLWGVPDGLGFFAAWQHNLHTRVALVCSSQTAAEQCRSALEALLAAARSGLQQLIASVGEKLKAGQLPIETAHQYEQFLKQSLAAVEGSQVAIDGQFAWLKTDWNAAPAALAAAALQSREAIVAEWYAAAMRADTDNHLRLLDALAGYGKAHKHFPPGAEGGALLPPETRLSWLAQLLPYLGHADWHRQLQFGYPWNSSQNERITRRTLPEVINPAVGQRESAAGFPVTHYVGVAGVGADAGRLPASDPRAGMFGYGRTTRPEDLPRGASNTIAIMGVADRLGPWGCGGEATVRPLTKRPYVNGPDGFGSGQPDGMLVGMADGSVRFLSNDTDPELIERLATLGQEVLAKADGLPRMGPRLDGGPGAGQKLGPTHPPKPFPTPTPQPNDLPRDPLDPGPAEPKPEVQLPDIPARLADTLPALHMERVPLLQALEVLSNLCTLPITIDTDALAELDVELDDEVSIELSATTIGKALEEIARSRGLLCLVEKTQLLLTSPQEHRQRLVTQHYPVDDLAGDQAETEMLGLLVQKLLRPESWHIAGGPGKLQASARGLSVTQTESIHHQLKVFLDKLRSARRLPPRSGLDRELLKLQTRWAMARPMLQQTLTANFRQPAPLAEVLAYLAQAAHCQIVIDHAALAAAGRTAASKTSLAVEKQPFETALRELLWPLGLAWRIVDHRTIQITSRQALAARLELEFYPVQPLLDKGTSAAELAETIRSRVAPASWNEAGGPGLIWFDKPAACLIVLQSQPVHSAVEQLLAEIAQR